jgi:hypothetical protein
MLGDERRQARNEPQRGHARRGGERQDLAPPRAAHGLDAFAQFGQRARHRAGQAQPFAGEFERTVAALEERRAQRLFEAGDLAAHRRLRDEALFGRLGERQVARGGIEHRERVERRQAGGIECHVRMSYRNAMSAEMSFVRCGIQ